MRRRPDGAGFSLVEMLIALLLLGVAMAIAAGLLSESVRILAHSVARARNPLFVLAVAQLRNDVLAARSLPTVPIFDWQEQPLALTDSSGVVRLWSLSGRRLWRQTGLVGGALAGRPVIDQVTAFRWRVWPAGLVEVVLGAELDLEPYVRQATATRIRPGERSERLERLLLSPRGLASGGGG